MPEKMINERFRIGLKLLASIGCTELLIMAVFRFTHIKIWMSPLLVDLTDTLLLCATASFLIFYWVVNPMKILQEREKADEKYRLLHHRNELILDSAGEGIFGIDLEGTMTFMNPAAADMLGYETEELLGTVRHSFIHHSKHDGTPHPPEECLIYASYKNDKVYHVDNEVFWKKDGTSFSVEYTSTPIREDGKVTGAVVIFKDITGRKQTEKTMQQYNDELLALADASNVILTTTTTTALYEMICEIAVRNFGLKMAWLGLVVKDSYEVKVAGQYPLDDEYMKTGKITWDDLSTGMGPTGRAIKTRAVHVVDDMKTDTSVAPWRERALKWGFHSSLTAPMITSEGEVIGAINLYKKETHFFTPQRRKLFQVFANQAATAIENAWLVENLEQRVLDRTQEFETANQRLLTMNDELALRRSEAETAKVHADAANRAKSDFLANMSHELRTPLNSIIGFSEILEAGIAGPIADNQKELANDISTSGKHLLSLINDILDLSKVEAGKMELDLGEFNLNALIDGSLVMFKEKAMKHNIKIEAEVTAEIKNVIADERKIKQVLFNLLSNAFKFTPDGGSVRVTAQLSVSDFVEIAVEDTGIGISPDDLKKLFQPFQQIDSVRSRKYSGTGLGLNLCRKFVELHGGRIWTESEVNKGSRFVFVIPIKQTMDRMIETTVKRQI